MLIFNLSYIILYVYIMYIVLLQPIAGDYDCLCNYNVELSIHSQPNSKSPSIGYLYEFDCKELLSLTDTPKGWHVFAFQHKYGYVSDGDDVEIQTCAGSPPISDKVTPPISSTTASSMTTTLTTTTRLTSSPSATTTTPPTTLPVTTTPTTTLPPTTTSPSTLPPTTTPPTTLPTTTTNDLSTILSGRTTTTGQTNIIVGDTSLCPPVLHRYTLEDKGALTQYGDYCYEIVPIRAIWSRAESDCIAKGGDLFHIDSQQLQDYIYRWIKSYNFDHAVWTGLHDVRTEEHFEWISGDHVVYTNFHFDRKGNFASHYNEDCVLFVPYAPYYGQWDDVICGSITALGDVGQQNPFVCEFSIHPQHNLQIVG